MSQEYYAVEKETNLGALNIGLNVFQSIAVKTVESIDGVQFEGNMLPRSEERRVGKECDR